MNKPKNNDKDELIEQKEIKSSEEKNLDESVKKITKTGRDQKEEKRRKKLRCL